MIGIKFAELYALCMNDSTTPLEVMNAAYDEVDGTITALTAERDELKAALELGQLNCDAEYDGLRGERDAARDERKRLTARVAELTGIVELYAPDHPVLDEQESFVVLTPRQCNRACYVRGFEAAQKSSIEAVDNLEINIEDSFDAKLTRDIEIIRMLEALVVPSDCGCNPLTPAAVDTCGLCKNFKRCESLFGCKSDATECDWMPSRFERA